MRPAAIEAPFRASLGSFGSGMIPEMPHWLIKSALQRAISLLPASHVWMSLIDQYSYFDRSIAPFNFLKYSPAVAST